MVFDHVRILALRHQSQSLLVTLIHLRSKVVDKPCELSYLENGVGSVGDDHHSQGQVDQCIEQDHPLYLFLKVIQRNRPANT